MLNSLKVLLERDAMSRLKKTNHWGLTQMSKMTEEEKAAAEAAAKEAELEAGLAEEEKQKAEEEAALLQKNTEYEQLIEAERLRAEEAERKLEETRQKAKERIEKKREGEFEDDKPVTLKDIKSVLQEERELIHKESQEERAKNTAKSLAESEPEANLIFEIWKHRKLAGSIDEQIKEAHAIATYSKTQKMNSELKRSLMGKEGVSKDNLNAQRKPYEGGEPKVDPTDKAVLTGYVWDKTKQAYKKTIAGGRKTFYVSKDFKKRWVENN